MPNNNPQQSTPQQQISRAAEGANRAAEKLESSAENAASVAIEKVRQVRDEAQSGIEQQREQIANRVRRLSGVLRSGSQTLSTDDPLAEQLFETAGTQIERVADYIENVTPGSLADDVTSLARRRPGLFFGGSFILGLALGRFAKSSASVARASIESDGLDDYEETLSVRPAQAPRPRQQQQTKRSARTAVDAPYTSSTAGSSSAPNTSSASSTSAASSTPSTTSTGSRETATVGSGSAHTPTANAAPSYGSATTQAKAPVAKQADEGTASSKPHTVDPGQGAKS